MLREIEKLLKDRGPMTIREIAVYFDSSPEAIHKMIQKLESKERLSKAAVSCNKNCACCSYEGVTNDVQSEVWAINPHIVQVCGLEIRPRAQRVELFRTGLKYLNHTRIKLRA
ncbi:FeoC-like transcriptional regulator [Verrucomicrobiota bacterium]